MITEHAFSLIIKSELNKIEQNATACGVKLTTYLINF